ncbi:hypothetical protein MMC10_003054 [Thelotrema lepadinum]|nr:hypothetical protein [Thelotrema lepadinum]
MKTFIIVALTSSFSLLANAFPQNQVNGLTCPTSPPGVANSNDGQNCCAGTWTTASGGAYACCKGGSFTLSTPDGFPFGTASELSSINIGTCSTVVPVTQTDYSSVIFGSGGAGVSPTGTGGAAGATGSNAGASPTSSSSKAGAHSPMITQGPVMALAGLAAAGVALL